MWQTDRHNYDPQDRASIAASRGKNENYKMIFAVVYTFGSTVESHKYGWQTAKNALNKHNGFHSFHKSFLLILSLASEK